MRFIWPMESPVVTRGFFFTDPLYLGGQHAAIDIICSSMPTYGAPVFAVADGVLYASPINDRLSGCNVYIDHADGWRSGYRHFREQIFPVGQPIPVAQGQLIGYANSTGTVTGPHLHFDLWNHEKKDQTAFYKVGWYAHNPEKYLEEADVPTQAEWDEYASNQLKLNQDLSKKIDNITVAVQELEKWQKDQLKNNQDQGNRIDDNTRAIEALQADD